jgi:signal transduction histidine kinase
MKNQPVLCKLILCNTILSNFTAIIWTTLLQKNGVIDSFSLGVLLVFSVILMIIAIIKYSQDTVIYIRITLIVQIVALFFILPIINDFILIQFLLINSVLSEIAIYEKPLLSKIISPVVLLFIFLYQYKSSVLMGTSFHIDFKIIIIVAELNIITSLIYMVYYREQLLYEKNEIYNIQGIMKQLTKTNLEYQDYAIGAEKSATIQERNRITRDIHDIVGYTLTNTIMMLEAATDMMQRNPLGVAALIKTTRENTQDGLEETRRALYKLREKTPEQLKGMAAVLQMIKLFEKATRVKVTILWNNISWSFDEQINFIIFHGIQQGLINSFIHGKALHVVIHGEYKNSNLKISIKDDGIGCVTEEINEGIGLKGLRERLEKIDGYYEADNIFDGFLMTIYIPLSSIEDVYGEEMEIKNE